MTKLNFNFVDSIVKGNNMPVSKLTEEDKAQICKLYVENEKLTPPMLARQLNFPVYVVRNYLKKAGLFKGNRKHTNKDKLRNITQGQIEYIKGLYLKENRKAIAEYLDIPYNSVGHFLSSHGINTREKAKEKNLLKAQEGKYFNPFDKLDENSSYLLGYILGDGCIHYKKGSNTPYLDISSVDLHILESFRDLYWEDAEIKTNMRNKYFWYSLRISDYIIVKTLEELGIHQRKSSTPSNPIIPNNYKEHYLRGLFDSDGCVYKPIRKNDRVNVSIVGHPSYINRFKEVDYDFLGFRIYTDKRKKCLVSLNLTSIESVKRFYDYIYPTDNVLCLKRKKDIFNSYYIYGTYNKPRIPYNKGIPMSEEQKIKMRKPKVKNRVINLDTREIFNSLREAANNYGLKKTCGIKRTIEGNQKTCKGFRWSYYVEGM
ncbi:MAG: hypothetical protein ACOC1K_04980 [Nanoarchaeota archaeon]